MGCTSLPLPRRLGFPKGLRYAAASPTLYDLLASLPRPQPSLLLFIYAQSYSKVYVSHVFSLHPGPLALRSQSPSRLSMISCVFP